MTDWRKTVRGWTIATAVAIGCAWTQPGLAQFNMPDGPIACDAFVRNGYGAWRVVRPTTIMPQGLTMNLVPGMTFAPSQTIDGIEITAVLDRNCGNR
jgi:hypothetical protein